MALGNLTLAWLARSNWHESREIEATAKIAAGGPLIGLPGCATIKDESMNCLVSAPDFWRWENFDGPLCRNGASFHRYSRDTCGYRSKLNWWASLQGIAMTSASWHYMTWTSSEGDGFEQRTGLFQGLHLEKTLWFCLETERPPKDNSRRLGQVHHRQTLRHAPHSSRYCRVTVSITNNHTQVLAAAIPGTSGRQLGGSAPPTCKSA